MRPATPALALECLEAPAAALALGWARCDNHDRDLFAPANKVTIGNDGKHALFWESVWLLDMPLRLAMPTVFQHSRSKTQGGQGCSFWSQLDQGPAWWGGISVALIPVFLQLWHLIPRSDVIKWMITTSIFNLFASVRWHPAFGFQVAFLDCLCTAEMPVVFLVPASQQDLVHS